MTRVFLLSVWKPSVGPEEWMRLFMQARRDFEALNQTKAMILAYWECLLRCSKHVDLVYTSGQSVVQVGEIYGARMLQLNQKDREYHTVLLRRRYHQNCIRDF